MWPRLVFCLGLMTVAGGPWKGPVSADEVELEGDLEVIVTDDFERGRSERAHYLRDPERGLLRIHLVDERPAHRHSGERVVVKGRVRGDGAVEDATGRRRRSTRPVSRPFTGSR